jgi:tetraacyldisaccharide 4'-kinase
MPTSNQQSPLQAFFLETWYNKRWWAWLLLPMAWLYQLLSSLHSYWQKKQSSRIPVPVVVIGNISVGGTGKTPVIIALAKALLEQGIAVGIISRGYGSQAPHYPYRVNSATDSASIAGDEPLLISQATACPIVIDKDRVAAARYLLKACPEITLILSDDGLQHHRLERDMEIVVVDGQRGLGNHFCLPAGPLREPARRLASVDWVLVNQEQNASQEQADSDALLSVTLAPHAWRHIASQQIHPLQPLPWLEGNTSPAVQTVQAVAGIGHPQRFFRTLETLVIDCETQAFDDHYGFTQADFADWQDKVVLMTEKDAVKCRTLSHSQCWSLIVEMTLPDTLVASVVALTHKQSS